MRSTKWAGMALALTIYPALAMVQNDFRLNIVNSGNIQQSDDGEPEVKGRDTSRPTWLKALDAAGDGGIAASQARAGEDSALKDRTYAMKAPNAAGLWIQATGAASDDESFGPLENQYAHVQTLGCANRTTVTGFALSKIGDRLAPNIYCGASKKHVASRMGESYFGTLKDQYADTRPLACPPGKFVQIFAFQKRGNRLAPRIKCEGSRKWIQATGTVDGPSQFGPLESSYADTKVLTCPGTKRVSKFRFVKRGDRLAPAIYCE